MFSSTPPPSPGSAYFTAHNNFGVYGGCAAKNDFEGHDGLHFNNVYAFMGMGLDNGLACAANYITRLPLYWYLVSKLVAY